MTTATQDYFRVPEFTRADRLRKAREELGLDQGAFAELIGVSRGTVSNYERGTTPADRIVVLRAWALATRVSYEWLLHGETPRPEGPGGLKYAIRDSNPEPAD